MSLTTKMLARPDVARLAANRCEFRQPEQAKTEVSIRRTGLVPDHS
jgi:hypothetical protein